MDLRTIPQYLLAVYNSVHSLKIGIGVLSLVIPTLAIAQVTGAEWLAWAVVLYYGTIVTIIVGLSVIGPYRATLSTGASMMPAIPLGGTLTISHLDWDSVSVGDTVSGVIPLDSYNEELIENFATKSREDSIIAHHRVYSVTDNNEYILLGDARDETDPHLFSEEEIIAKDVQFGYQPLYIPLTPLAFIATLVKLFKGIQGRHSSLLEQAATRENISILVSSESTSENEQ